MWNCPAYFGSHPGSQTINLGLILTTDKKGKYTKREDSKPPTENMARNLKYEVNFLFKKKKKKKKAQILKVMPQGKEMATCGQPVECMCALLCFLYLWRERSQHFIPAVPCQVQKTLGVNS